MTLKRSEVRFLHRAQMRIEVIYETPDFLAVNKPAGLLVHPTKLRIKNAELRIEEPTLTDWLLKHYPEIENVGDSSVGGQVILNRPGIVHRLDKDTSGVILICRNQNFFEYAKKLFQDHQIKKTYLALVWGKLEPKTGIIKKPISIKTGAIKRTVWHGKAEKEAITEYEVIKFLKSKVYKDEEQFFSLVKVMPKTGRTHQIRVHLASIGHPIVGDSLYGQKSNSFDLKRQFLHAESLEFTLPSGGRIKIETELPEDLKNVLEELDGQNK